MMAEALTPDAKVSRRSIFGTVALGSVGTVAMMKAPLADRALAQEATPMAGSHSVVDELIAAFTAGDIDRGMALYHADAIFQEFPSHPQPVTGVDQIREAFVAAAAPFSEIKLEAVNVVVEGDRIATETRQMARYSNSIQGFPEATGQPVEFRFASFLELEDGKIKRDTTYTDLFTLLVQIGAIPAPGAA